MDNSQLNAAFAKLSTPLMADGCTRLGLPLRLAPFGIHALTEQVHVAGRALPVRHFGSVDVFLEAMRNADHGEVLVIDNGGRTDEGCIGDLIVLEAAAAGISAVVVWGTHRDSAEICAIGLPVFSYGSCPAGPQRLEERDADALQVAHCGDLQVTRNDAVFADRDGVLFVCSEHVESVIRTAREISEKERTQAESIKSGTTLSEQLQFESYLIKRAEDSSLSFREHLRAIGGAIEE